jgi:hypothetical protein
MKAVHLKIKLYCRKRCIEIFKATHQDVCTLCLENNTPRLKHNIQNKITYHMLMITVGCIVFLAKTLHTHPPDPHTLHVPP